MISSRSYCHVGVRGGRWIGIWSPRFLEFGSAWLIRDAGRICRQNTRNEALHGCLRLEIQVYNSIFSRSLQTPSSRSSGPAFTPHSNNATIPSLALRSYWLT